MQSLILPLKPRIYVDIETDLNQKKIWMIGVYSEKSKTYYPLLAQTYEYEKDIFSQCDWVWVDSFQTIWFDAEYLASLKKLGLKVALVSPELHNRKREMEQVKEIVNSVKVDAICTDLPDFWYR